MFRCLRRSIYQKTQNDSDFWFRWSPDPKTGKFCISPSAMFELWDILGMIPGKSDNLANLYIMLGVMNSIHDAALYGAGDDDDEEEELTDAELN